MRLFFYIYNPSLWLDEAMLAVNVIRKGFLELAGTLDLAQVAPFGFLWVEKAFVAVLGYGERAFRLAPLLLSLASIYMFYSIARRILNERYALVATAFFAVNPAFLKHSVEAKHYAFEVFATLLLVLVCFELTDKKQTAVRTAIYALLGIAAMLSSISAAFVLVAVVIALLCTSLKDSGLKARSLAVSLVWLLVAALIYYRLRLAAAPHMEYLRSFWALDRGGIVWLLRDFYDLFNYMFKPDFQFAPIPLGLAAVFALMWLAGAAVLPFARAKVWLVLVLPVLSALLASQMGMYPIYKRLGLFLHPLLLLTAFYGLAALHRRAKGGAKSFVARAVALLFVAVAAFMTLLGLKSEFAARDREDYRSALAALESGVKDGDEVYLSYFVYAPTIYYTRYAPDRFSLEAARIIEDPHCKGCRCALPKLAGKRRVWMLFRRTTIHQEGQLFVCLAERGRLIRRALFKGVFVALFDFSNLR